MTSSHFMSLNSIFSLPKPLLQTISCLIYLSSQQTLRHTRLLKFSISKIKPLNPPYPPLNLFSLNFSISESGNSILPAPQATEPSLTPLSLHILYLIHQPILLATPSEYNQISPFLTISTLLPSSKPISLLTYCCFTAT